MAEHEESPSDGYVRRGVKTPTPFLPAVMYPSHIFWVPRPLFAIGFMVAMIAGFIVGAIDGHGIEPVAIGITFIAYHAFVASRFLRDPHIWRVWSRRFVYGRPYPTIVPVASSLSDATSGETLYVAA